MTFSLVQMRLGFVSDFGDLEFGLKLFYYHLFFNSELIAPRTLGGHCSGTGTDLSNTRCPFHRFFFIKL